MFVFNIIIYIFQSSLGFFFPKKWKFVFPFLTSTVLRVRSSYLATRNYIQNWKKNAFFAGAMTWRSRFFEFLLARKCFRRQTLHGPAEGCQTLWAFGRSMSVCQPSAGPWSVSLRKHLLRRKKSKKRLRQAIACACGGPAGSTYIQYDVSKHAVIDRYVNSCTLGEIYSYGLKKVKINFTSKNKKEDIFRFHFWNN